MEQPAEGEPPQAGDVLEERYRLEAPIGAGGMGTVWRAEHLKLQAPVAVKVLHHAAAKDDEWLDRFLREAKSAAALRGSNVVQVLDYGVSRGLPFIVMELLGGESLQQIMKRDAKLPPAVTAEVLTQVGRAMARAHKMGIVHRDLKPGNIQVCAAEDGEIVVKVLDFGIAKTDGKVEGAKTATGSMLGTPVYMSPEQARGAKGVDHRADLWSLAAIAFECLCGRRLFEADTLGDLILSICIEPLPVPSEVANVPEGFDAWFARATQRKPDQRFQSARAMIDALRVVLLPDSSDRPSVGWVDSLSPPSPLPESVAPTVHGVMGAAAPVVSRPLTAATSTGNRATGDRAPVEPALRTVASVGPAKGAAAPGKPLGDPKQAAILIVDDNEHNREMLARRLKLEGYTNFTMAEHGREALDLLVERRFDLILLDIMMPVMDGFEVLEHLKADMHLRSVPVVVISADDELDSVARCLELGAEDHLAKPFNKTLLRARVAASLDRARLRQRLELQVRRLDGEKQRVDVLLDALVPRGAARELRARGGVPLREYDQVTLLAYELCDFSGRVASMPPRALGQDVSAILSSCEALVFQHHLDALGSRGAVWMCGAGLFSDAPDAAAGVVQCAVDMVRSASMAVGDWALRAAVHQGVVTAGTLGSKQLCFGAWGPTVDALLALLAHAAPGETLLSDTAWLQVQDGFRGKSRGLLDLAGQHLEIVALDV